MRSLWLSSTPATSSVRQSQESREAIKAALAPSCFVAGWAMLLIEALRSQSADRSLNQREIYIVSLIVLQHMKSDVGDVRVPGGSSDTTPKGILSIFRINLEIPTIFIREQSCCRRR